MVLKPQSVYVAPGNRNIILRRNEANEVVISSSSKRFKEFNNPSVDALMISASETYGERVLGVILTGMGRDGAQGMLRIKQNGGCTAAQDEKTCVVFGMPKEAIKLGAVDHVASIQDMGMFLISCLS
jgi:two-component system chemotaxis response regulator CheB